MIVDCIDAAFLAEVARARRRAVRRSHQPQRQSKADRTGGQQRSQRIFLYFLRDSLCAVTESIAAIVISVLGIAHGRIRGVARGIFGLAVEVLRRACRFAGPARCLSLCITSEPANGAFDFTGDILRRAGNSIFVHGAPYLKETPKSQLQTMASVPPRRQPIANK